MNRGKTIVIEGTDCSGKETQSKLLIDRLNNQGLNTEYYTFPNYDKPTGEIIGLSYLGKPYLAERLVDRCEEEVVNKVTKCFTHSHHEEIRYITSKVLKALKEELSHGWFLEGATNVPAKVASLYYTADRMYCIPEIEDILNKGINVVLDRYSYSNFGHQASKLKTLKEQLLMFNWLEELEFKLGGLPESDIKIFLHMPTEYTSILKSGREEKLDEHEVDTDFLKRSEEAFLEMADRYDFDIINCVRKTSDLPSIEDIKSKNEISEEVYDVVSKRLKI